jgi:hypothetical protein
MINIDDKTRRLSQASIVIGYKQENKAESIEFEIPEYLKEYGKKICFKTKDGKVFSKVFDNITSNIFTFTRTETQYGELDATIQFFKAEDEDIIIYKTSMLHIIFKDAVICEDEIQPDDPKYPIIEDLIIKVSNITKDITTINKNIEDIDKKNNEQDTKIQTNETDIADIKKVNIKQDNNIKELQAENEQLKNQIPNGTASGNEIYLTDSSNMPIERMRINGGHSQDTRSGRNLYDIKNVGDRPIPPEISIDDDDWITITADNSSGTSVKYVNYFTKNLNLKPNTQYSLIAEFKKCTGDDSVSLSLVNNGNNEGQFNINQNLKISSIKENNTKKIKLIITTKADLSNTKNGLRTYLYMPAGTSVIITFRLSVIEDTSVELDNFKYEKYEVSPSPDYPSEIETVSGSVKIDVVNNNLSDFNVTQNGKVKVNEDGTITINGNGGFSLSFRKFIVKANTKYYLRWELISGTVSGANIFMNPILKKGWINKNTFVESSVTEDSEISGIGINGSAVFSNAKIKIWISKSQNDFTKHQSQSVTMPIQQEMLEGDYIDDVEHHEWKKIILTGEETIIYYNAPSTEIANNLDTAYFTIGISEKAQGNSNNIISNMFKNLYTASAIWGNANSTSKTLKESIAVDASIRLRINKNRLQGYDNSQTSNEKVVLLKTYLKSLYDAGTPVIVYYKLATPLDLELTTEQKAIREQKLHTYKNVTNISLSNDLSNVDVSYKKDIETMFNNLQSKLIANIEKPK